MKELRAACEQPGMRDTLEVRARWRAGGNGNAHALMLTRRGCSHAQARDRGYAPAAVLQQLEAAALLGRVDALVGDAVVARAALAPRTFEATTEFFAALPHALALRIFRLVPADARARAALVCRAWRDAIAEPRVWTHLDLLPSSGVRVPVTDTVLRGAAARARGQIEMLSLSPSAVSSAELLEVVTDNADSLRELHGLTADFWQHTWDADLVEQIARAAVQLRILEVSVHVKGAVALRMVCKDEPYGALRLRDLEVIDTTPQDLLALATEIERRREPLHRLVLLFAPLQTLEVLDAVAKIALACRVSQLMLLDCGLSQASVPSLTRILRGGNLTSLKLVCTDSNFYGVPLFDAAAALQFADAVAAHRTLLRLRLVSARLWHHPAAAAAVLRAVTGHPTLQELEVRDRYIPDPAAAGAALGALVAANAPALCSLWVSGTPLGDVGMRPLLVALATNTHLQLLICRNTGTSEDFARDVLIPGFLRCAQTRALAETGNRLQCLSCRRRRDPGIARGAGRGAGCCARAGALAARRESDRTTDCVMPLRHVTALRRASQ